MAQQIAVTLSPDNRLTTLQQAAHISVYANGPQGWARVADHPVCFAADPKALRSQLDALAEALGDCRILASQKVEGIAYHRFNRLGYAIFELASVSDAALDGILADVSQPAAPAENSGEPTAPYSPEDDGHYQLDLIRAQQAHPELSSKKAFRDFLDNAAFVTFTLTCSHLPPWTEAVAQTRGLTVVTEALPGGALRAVFSHPACDKR